MEQQFCSCNPLQLVRTSGFGTIRILGRSGRKALLRNGFGRILNSRRPGNLPNSWGLRLFNTKSGPDAPNSTRGSVQPVGVAPMAGDLDFSSADSFEGDDDRRRDAFARLFAQHDRWLFAYLVSLLGSSAAAEEVFQEVCVVLWREYETFRVGNQFCEVGERDRSSPGPSLSPAAASRRAAAERRRRRSAVERRGRAGRPARIAAGCVAGLPAESCRTCDRQLGPALLRRQPAVVQRWSPRNWVGR